MIFLLTLLIFIIDIGSKMLVNHFMSIDSSIPLINKFLYITYVKNTGVAWSLFDSNYILVLIVSFIVIMGIILYVYKEKTEVFLLKLSYSFILGGAIGNFVNRLVYGHVIDFIDIKIFGYNYPIFNFADTFIVIGVIMLAVYTWRCSNGNRSIRK